MPAEQSPNWWFYLYSVWSFIGMATLLYQYTFTPYETFMGSYPHGFDKVTDVIKPGSVRVETFVLWQSAGYIFIWGIETFLPLFAKDLPAPHQKKIMACLIYPALASDAFLIGLALLKTPREVVMDRARWTESLRGILTFVPIGSIIKFLWVFGVGASKARPAKKSV